MILFTTFISLVLLAARAQGLKPQILPEDLLDKEQFSKTDWETYYLKQHAEAKLPPPGYLLADATDKYLNNSDRIDAKILELLERDGPDMRPTRGYKDFDDIDIDTAVRSWSLLHRHAFKAINDKIDHISPFVGELLDSANASKQCKTAVRQILRRARSLDSWAVKLINSWPSFPPAEIFEGTYTLLGSYSTCVNLPQNRYINHTHYCTLSFRPVLPSRPDYELVLRKEPDKLLKMFQRHSRPGEPTEKNALEDLLEHSNYNHYLYYKLGTCWPIDCSPYDVRKIAKLLGKRNILMQGPVKCFSAHRDDYEADTLSASFGNRPGDLTSTSQRANFSGTAHKLVISSWNKNQGGIYIWKPYITGAQEVALVIIAAITMIILLTTILDLTLKRIPSLYLSYKGSSHIESLNDDDGGSREFRKKKKQVNSVEKTPETAEEVQLNGGDLMDKVLTIQLEDITKSSCVNGQRHSFNRKASAIILPEWFPSGWIDDLSIITNTGQFFRVSGGQLRNDILCLNGIRCITMIWIIMAHTMMYNDWSAFARTREIEKSLRSLVTQPLFNGSYLVDTFFFMSGLLSSFTTFKIFQGRASKFKPIAFIIGRWSRLTPQIFFMSMIYIVWPLFSSGPHWFPVVGEYSENCIENWWINTLHLQAFYKKDRMCNAVTWWVSIDFFYHFLAVALVWVFILTSHKIGLLATASLVGLHVICQANLHYASALPPNFLSSIPQTGAMWSQMTLNYFWTPCAHAVPFFAGFYLGYLLSTKSKSLSALLNRRTALIGWTISTLVFVSVSYSTFWWVIGEASYGRLGSTVFHITCPIVWVACLSWAVSACYLGYGGFIDQFLSAKVFVVLSKASYMVYLSHFLILFLFYGNQNLLLEPSPLVMFYVVIGNTLLSTLLGIFLCVVYEIPWLKLHRKLMKYV